MCLGEKDGGKERKWRKGFLKEGKEIISKSDVVTFTLY